MTDLSHCIDLHKTSFPKEEIRGLRLESRKLAMEKKIKLKEAMIQVVRSRIAETQIEYNKIETVIKKHYKVPVGEVVPEKKEPAKAVSEKKAVSKKKVVSEKKEPANVKFSVADKGPVYVRLGTLTDEVLSRMNKYLKSLGYDVHGKKDIYEMLVGPVTGDRTKPLGKIDKNKEIHHPDWADAYEKAMQGVEVRKNKLKIKKEAKASSTNVNWDRIKELGETSDIREAGYITPNGDLIDLSGKREGGQQGMRSYDHREAGGTAGMQEYIALGNIRMDARSGSMDILIEPTPEQYKKIAEIVALNHGEVIIDLGEGLGEFSKSNDYYFDPKRTFSFEYSKGTPLSEIKNDIENFYAGKDIKKSNTRFSIIEPSMGITPTMREAIQSKGQALFAKAKRKTEEKLTVDTARAEIAARIGEKAVNALERTEKIKLLTMDEAVELTGRQDLRKSGAQGFYYGGTVYLLPGGIDKGKAWNVLMHELGVHYGFIKIFGKKLAKEVFNAFTLKRYNDDKLGKAIARAFNRIPESTPFDFRSEEAVAYFAEENANIDLPLYRKIIARMRLWAVKYFDVKPDVFTHDDYVALAASAMRGAVKEAERAPVRGGVSKEVFYSFSGVKAKSAPTGQLAKAQEMLAGGKSEKDIWRETGWMKGVEKGNVWKFEIDDSGARIRDAFKNDIESSLRGYQTKKDRAATLEEVINHPKIFKAYPELRNLTVGIQSEIGGHSAPGAIFLGPKSELATLLHEIQHAIQTIEGFAPGGSPETMRKGFVMSDEAYRALQNEVHNKFRAVELFKTAEEKGITAKQALAEESKRWGLDTGNDRIRELIDIFETKKEAEKYWKEDKARLDKYVKETFLEPDAAYRKLAGEIEARDTAVRTRLTTKQRREQMPYKSQGIPQNQWIVTDGKGTSFSVKRFTSKEGDIRYSVAEKKDLQSWADDLIKSAKKKGVVMDKKTPSPERLRETSVSTLAGLDIKKLDQSARSFLQGMSPKGKGYGAAIEKWLASPEWYQHPVLKKIVKRALDKSERFHTLFNEFNAVDDPMAEHDTVAKTLEVLARKGGISKAAFILGRTSADFKKLETLLDDADVYGEKHTVEELKERGYSKDVIQAWSVVRVSYDKQLEALIKPMKDLVARIKEQAAFMGTEPLYPDFGDFIIDGKKRRLTLKEAVMEMGRYKGTYSPRIRNRGEWVVKGKKEGVVSEGGDSYFRDNRKTKSFANLLRDKLVKEGYTDVKVEKESRLPEETFQAVRMAEMGTMIGHAASKGLDKYDGEMQMAFMDEVITASADLIKSRGARSTMIKRREGLAVRGYITNPLIRFVRYTGTNAAGIAKGEMAQHMIKDLYGEYVNGKKVGGIDATKEGEIHSLARAYIEEQLRNAETGDRIIGVMKALTTFKFLGFNPRSVLVNITALTTSVPMALHTYAMDGKGSMLRIGKVLSKSCKDYTKVMAGKRLTDVDEQTFIDDFRAAGYTDAQYTRDAMGNVQGAYGTAWSKLIGGSMYVFGKSEEWVRGGTALAAYRLCRKQGLSHIDANKKAIEATAKAHGTYGKETLPMVAWGKGFGRLGQAFYTYMKFPHNYLQMLYDAGVRKKNVKGVIFGIAAPAVLGGIAATPMYATAMALANALMSLVDDDRDAEKFVYDTLNEYIGKTGEETVRGGALGLLDLDISGSLAMGPGAIPTSLYDLTGAVGGMVNDIYKGAGYAAAGEYGRAAEKILPKFTGTVFTAIREMKEGATTSKGDRVWDEEGRPYIPKISETVKRGFGFRSARRALLAQSTWVSKREEQRFKKTASDIYKKIKYLTAGAENVIINSDVGDKISNYNQNALKTNNIPLITPASVERQLERMKTPTTKQKARVTKYERAATFEGDIWAGALGVADEMDKTQSEIKHLSDAGILKYSAPPSRNINAGYGIKVKLDDDQYSRYVADTSAMIKIACDRLVSSPWWQKWNDKQRAFVVKRVINEGRKIVRDRLKITILRSRMKRRK